MTLNQLIDVIDLIRAHYEKREIWKAIPVQIQFNEVDVMDLETQSIIWDDTCIRIISPVEFEPLDEDEE